MKIDPEAARITSHPVERNILRVARNDTRLTVTASDIPREISTTRVPRVRRSCGRRLREAGLFGRHTAKTWLIFI